MKQIGSRKNSKISRLQQNADDNSTLQNEKKPRIRQTARKTARRPALRPKLDVERQEAEHTSHTNKFYLNEMNEVTRLKKQKSNNKCMHKYKCNVSKSQRLTKSANKLFLGSIHEELDTHQPARPASDTHQFKTVILYFQKLQPCMYTVLSTLNRWSFD